MSTEDPTPSARQQRWDPTQKISLAGVRFGFGSVLHLQADDFVLVPFGETFPVHLRVTWVGRTLQVDGGWSICIEGEHWQPRKQGQCHAHRRPRCLLVKVTALPRALSHHHANSSHRA